MKKIAFLLLVIIGFVACEKPEGQGGTNSITGNVIVWEYNGDFTVKKGEYPGQEVDVYIIYGSDEVYGDRFKTGYDGKYTFEYLREGTYTVYALSKDSTNRVTDEMIPVFQNVEISGKNNNVQAPDIIIVK